MRTLPQRATGYLKMQFRDLHGISMPPKNAEYRIDCLTTGQEVRGNTPFLVDETGEYTVKLTPDDNDFVNTANAREDRRVSVLGMYNQDDDEVTGAYEYSIRKVFINATV